MQLSQVAQATSGRLQGLDTSIVEVVTDTRVNCGGGLFVALKGENFDAHDFVDQAEKAGAVALLVEREVKTGLPSVQVDDTLTALASLATWWRDQFDIPLMAITGSVGKTTVKEMLASILAGVGDGVATKGNLNNEIGVPLTLLRLRQHHKYAVVEMGMNRAGEIRRLSNMAKPTVALVNNAGAAHLEGLGSVAAVAQAKGEIFDGLRDDGIAIINADDEYAALWQQTSKAHNCILFGLSTGADIKATYTASNEQIVIDINGLPEACQVHLNSVGEHSVRNALAAAAVANAVNVSVDNIVAGLEAFSAVPGRLHIEHVGKAILIDDTYNANPTSVRAAIDVLARYSNSLLILGDMAELGVGAEQEHRNLGAYAQAKGVKQLWTCGNYADQLASEFGADSVAYSDQTTLLGELDCLLDEQLLNRDNQPDALAILVKGSRSAQMENVVTAARRHLLLDTGSDLGGA